MEKLAKFLLIPLTATPALAHGGHPPVAELLHDLAHLWPLPLLAGLMVVAVCFRNRQ